MIISVDHGNKQIKTAHKVFSSGLVESASLSPLGGDNVYYEGKYYSLSEKQRIPYMRDKTKDDRFFILTLFAIAYEIEANKAYSADEIIDVQLLIGLPPAHFARQREVFEKYFLRDDFIEFKFNDKEYTIMIDKVFSAPQALAAIMPVFDQVKAISKGIIIDIGGMTVDYIMVKKGAADASVCDSLEHGVITLYNDIKSAVYAEHDMLCEESDIDAVLKNEETALPDEVVGFIKESAKKFVSDIIDQLRERGIDMKTSTAIFAGGGSLLLKEYIEAEDRIVSSLIIDSISANAKGYEVLYKHSKLSEKE